jgi:hypothetical protein
MQTNCVNHKGAVVDGYGIVKRIGKNVRAHRWAYCLANGLSLEEIQDKVVMHKCDNRLCINPKHLELGTHADNCADKVQKGRQARGEKSGNSKLKNWQVVLIKACLNQGATIRQIAKEFDVSCMTISRIKSGKTWGWL